MKTVRDQKSCDFYMYVLFFISAYFIYKNKLSFNTIKQAKECKQRDYIFTKKINFSVIAFRTT